jgi:hypothetical protein
VPVAQNKRPHLDAIGMMAGLGQIFVWLPASTFAGLLSRTSPLDCQLRTSRVA